MGGVDQPGEVGLGLVNVDRVHGGLQTGREFSPVVGPWLVRRAAAAEGALKQVLKGGIDPGHAHQHGATSAFLEHLQGDGAGCVSGSGVRRRR
jgi:predicted N-acyltransferase